LPVALSICLSSADPHDAIARLIDSGSTTARFSGRAIDRPLGVNFIGVNPELLSVVPRAKMGLYRNFKRRSAVRCIQCGFWAIFLLFLPVLLS
jgi:hypothetical protein